MSSRSLNDLRKAGIEALKRELGVTDMIRFLQIFEKGEGNYTKDRKEWLEELSIDEIVEEIKKEE
ncbi:MAG TPA: hypothetical protein VMX55_09990 [candidate division Zixibacteria bacterium]|nr:hypothetical protein [candidate division Zixibacteria bacterium]